MMNTVSPQFSLSSLTSPLSSHNLNRILDFLNVEELIRIRGVCKAWKKIIDNQTDRWERNCREIYQLNAPLNESWIHSFMTMRRNWQQVNGRAIEIKEISETQRLRLEQERLYYTIPIYSKENPFQIKEGDCRNTESFQIYTDKTGWEAPYRRIEGQLFSELVKTYRISSKWVVGLCNLREQHEERRECRLYVFHKQLQELNFISSFPGQALDMDCNNEIAVVLTAPNCTYDYHHLVVIDLKSKQNSLPIRLDGQMMCYPRCKILSNQFVLLPLLDGNGLLILDLHSSAHKRIEVKPSVLTHLRSATDGQRLAIPFEKGLSMAIWDLNALDSPPLQLSFKEFEDKQEVEGSVGLVASALQGSFVATCHVNPEEGFVSRVWNFKTRKCLFEHRARSRVRSLLISGSQFVVQQDSQVIQFDFLQANQVGRPKELSEPQISFSSRYKIIKKRQSFFELSAYICLLAISILKFLEVKVAAPLVKQIFSIAVIVSGVAFGVILMMQSLYRGYVFF